VLDSNQLKEPAPPASERPMAAEKRTRRTFDDDFKAKVVERVLRGRESGKETIASIAEDIKVSPSNLVNWLRAARDAPKPRAKKPAKATNGAAVHTTTPQPLNIVGLQAFIRAEVQSALRPIIREELRAILGDK
jgi:transposase-like protein